VALQRQMQEALATHGSSREVCERALLSLAALAGFSEEDMMQDVGWRAMRLGRRIERMQFIAQMLSRHLDSSESTRPAAVEWLLDVCDSTPIYHARFLGAPRLSSMLRLLLEDDGHPMSLEFLRRFIARDLVDLATALGGEIEPGMPVVPPLPERAERLDESGAAGDALRSGLAQQLAALAAASGDLSDRLSHRYFTLIEFDAHALAI
jgi:uncharacterized alpha-E superfamily protein